PPELLLRQTESRAISFPKALASLDIAGGRPSQYTDCTETCMTVAAAYDSLNRITGLAPFRAPDFDGDDPIAPTPFLIGAVAASSLGLGAYAANEIWRLRGGDQQSIRIGVHAAAASLVSFALLR